MKKTLTVLILLLLAAACTAVSPPAPTPAELPEGSPEPGAGPELPPFMLQPTPSLDDTHLEEKAAGFEYDYDSLTYELVWSDEFDYQGQPDPNKWGYDTGGHGWGNNELQTYTNDGNAWADGEKLIIEARAEEPGGREVTSARLVTRNKGDWLYGKIEVSAKLPGGRGSWPAIWMLPTDWNYNNTWPDSGEIDIMEHVGADLNRVHASIHTLAFHHSIGTNKGSGPRYIATATEEFHVYSIEWLPDRIHFFFDHELIYTYDPSNYTERPTYKHWPFDKRFHLLINIAWGGDWGGYRGVDDDALPVRMEIDYVRVYQSPEIGVFGR
jgi:beta-glucanase (GH16 family)